MEQWESQLDSASLAQRQQALKRLWQKSNSGELPLPDLGTAVNLHCHTTFSYNAYGYTPTGYAWRARQAGLAVAGIVDFDVLDGLEEFLAAAKVLNLKGCVGLETRAFVPEFADREINSPGEPGITYHMGVGFPTARLNGSAKEFLLNLARTARQRNVELMERVNRYLSPVELDYEKDVLPLTPAGNATERHMCLAYARKARSVFAEDGKLVGFWAQKLGAPGDTLDLPEGGSLLNLIRAKTMKRGGVGYVQPDGGSFPKMEAVNEFVLAAGGIPTLTWLNGLSEGERAMEELLEVAMSRGVAALNIIPDRNYTPGVQDEKLANLYRVVELAEARHLPLVVGTEMNGPGQKFVDDFATAELQPLVTAFLRGAYIVYGHSVLQRQCGLGYMSEWARESFGGVGEKNDFFERIGRAVAPAEEQRLGKFTENARPGEIMAAVKEA